MRISLVMVCSFAGLTAAIGCSNRSSKSTSIAPASVSESRTDSSTASSNMVLFGPDPIDTSLKLGKIPDLRMTPRPAVTEAQISRIKTLIAGLAAMDKPDYGLSATLSGSAFAPLADQARSGAGVITDHGLQTFEGMKALVAMGPDALPFLLDALDDATPTKIVVKPMMGPIWHEAELSLNPVNPAERDVALARAEEFKRMSEPLQPEKGAVLKKFDLESFDTPYTVKVGDVCFVVIGQIVGRAYEAVRYQPSAIVVVNSPVSDPDLRAEVRAIWRSENPARNLFDSLLADFATEGTSDGKSLDGWYGGHYLQCGAALRLSYYFPGEAAPLIASRLAGLDVGKDEEGDVDAFMRRAVANKVRSDEFVKAIAWFEAPAVREALVALFKRAGDTDTLLAALPAMKDVALIRDRLEPLVGALPADEGGPYGKGFHLLAALCERSPGTARAVFARYLRDASAQRCHTVCLVLRDVKADWDTDLLAPMLSDRRTWGWAYPVTPEANEPRRPIRVCDEAALTLSANHPEFRFTRAGEHADLDRQIAAIRERISRKK
jgi:hypothetical protein